MRVQTHRFDAWREAERTAHAVERALYLLQVRSPGRDSPELQALTQLAGQLRARARGLFDEAMLEMKELAESLHHRRVLAEGRDVSATSAPAAPPAHACPARARP
ncbi:MAG TPA: hypothetical protein VF453_02745 [Burkholderiaceae bacterium]